MSKSKSLSCRNCNGWHTGRPCPKRILLRGRYYRVLSIDEFARRRRAAYRKMNADRDDAWKDLERVSLFCPSLKKLLPISSTPYVSRMYVERIGRQYDRKNHL